MKKTQPKREAGATLPAAPLLGRWWGRIRERASIGANPPVSSRSESNSSGLRHDKWLWALRAIGAWLIPRCGPLPEKSVMFSEPDWLKLLKLRVAICYKTLQLRYALARHAKLLKRISELEVKCGKLFLGKGDPLILDGSGCNVPNHAFDAIEHSVRPCRPNDPSSPMPTENKPESVGTEAPNRNAGKAFGAAHG